MILFLVCPTYLMWHQLHSNQYIRLLLWHVPLYGRIHCCSSFLSSLSGRFYHNICKFGSVATLVSSSLRLCNLCPDQHVLQGGRLPVCDHKVLPSQFSGSTRSTQIRPVFGYEFPEVGISTTCAKHQWCIGFLIVSSLR